MKCACKISLLLLFTTLSAYAQDADTAASGQTNPCEHRDEFDQFDFWLGDWDVRLASGTLAGTNKIEKTPAGCALIENWLGAAGTPGMSVNYFDMASKEWVQVWNSAGGVQINIRGGLTDDGMLLEGQINYVSNDTSAPFRGLWTLLPDGRVRQFFEQYDQDSESWAPWFEGFYTRTSIEPQMSEN